MKSAGLGRQILIAAWNCLEYIGLVFYGRVEPILKINAMEPFFIIAFSNVVIV